MKVLSRLIAYCDDKGLDIDYYQGISERGYEDKPILCANWNKPKLNRIQKWGESFFDEEVEFDWDDEWTACSVCYKAIRTQADSYGWTASFMRTEYDIICHEHYEEYQEDIIDYFKNNTNHAVMPEFYPILEKAGFVCYSPDEYCQRFETGFHPGQNDDPKKIAKDIEKELPNYDYIFKIDSVGQFDINWSVYLRKGETA